MPELEEAVKRFMEELERRERNQRRIEKGGDKIAFIKVTKSDTNLYMINEDGSNLRLLNNSYCTEFDWSPRGDKILYLRYFHDLVVTDGVNEKLIKQDLDHYLSSRWLDDGKILLEIAESNQNTFFHLIDESKGTMQYITSFKNFDSYSTIRTSISKKGKILVSLFLRDHNELLVIDPQKSNNPRRIWKEEKHSGLIGNVFTVCPLDGVTISDNGDLFAGVVYYPEKGNYFFIANTLGNIVKEIPAIDLSHVCDIQWSYDDKYVSFVSQVKGKPGYYLSILNTKSEEVFQICPVYHGWDNRNYGWSRKNNQLAVINRGILPVGIYIFDAENKNMKLLYEGEQTLDFKIKWQPKLE